MDQICHNKIILADTLYCNSCTKPSSFELSNHLEVHVDWPLQIKCLHTCKGKVWSKMQHSFLPNADLQHIAEKTVGKQEAVYRKKTKWIISTVYFECSQLNSAFNYSDISPFFLAHYRTSPYLGHIYNWNQKRFQITKAWRPCLCI